MTHRPRPNRSPLERTTRVLLWLGLGLCVLMTALVAPSGSPLVWVFSLPPLALLIGGWVLLARPTPPRHGLALAAALTVVVALAVVAAIPFFVHPHAKWLSAEDFAALAMGPPPAAKEGAGP